MNYIFLDTETETTDISNFQHELKFKIGVFQKVIRQKGKYVFRKPITSLNISSFHKNIYRELPEKCWLIAHNWHFDFFSGCFLDFIKFYGFEVQFFSFDANRFILKVANSQKEIVFVDSFNYFQFSLKKMGEILGYTKGEIDFKTASLEKLITYCIRDVNVLAKFFINFVETVKKNKANLGYTIANTAYKTYMNKFVPFQIQKSDLDVEHLEGKSYYGGRTECFRIGDFKDEFYMLDINSMYPDVMKNNKYPVELTDKETDYYIADCTVKVKFPCLPYRFNGKLCFPVGTFRGVWCSPELNLRGIEILEVHKKQYYKAAYIFSDYVDKFYELKKNGKNDFEILYSKLMLNSLYGKFAQKQFDTEKLGETDLSNGIHLTNLGSFLVLNGEMFKSDISGYSQKSHVAISSFCTSYARKKLFNSMLMAGFENLFYCDTDSLLVNKTGYLRLKPFISDRLGDWKLEQTGDSVTIRGCKMYQFGKKLRVKGVKKAVDLVNSYRQERWFKTKSLLKRGITDRVLIEDFTKNLSYIYDKGIVIGNKVYPLQFPLQKEILK
jgi:hypothetical protein